MGAELVVQTKESNITIAYWCRSSEVTKSFQECGLINNDDEVHELTEDKINRVIINLEEKINKLTKNIETMKEILDSPMSYEDKLEAANDIHDFEEQLAYLTYHANNLRFLEDQILFNTKGLTYYYSY